MGRGLAIRVAGVPVLGTLLRLGVALSYFWGPVKDLTRWLFRSNEISNFTYDLTDRNKRYLGAFISQVTGKTLDEVNRYISEIEQDDDLRRHVETVQRSSRAAAADLVPRYGRRIGWYAIVRAMKPRVIVETGVDQGLGACILTAALMKNRQEGCEGRYYGTDNNPKAGYLLSGIYADCGEVLYGDSIESLKTLVEKVDLFINDSDHLADYEAMEYRAIREKLSDRAILLSDNSHVTDELLDFALETERQFLFFQEQPRDHWYPGAGIGAAFRRQAAN